MIRRRTGQIPQRLAVDGALLAMAMTMMMATVRRTCIAVKKKPGKGREQRMGWENRR